MGLAVDEAVEEQEEALRVTVLAGDGSIIGLLEGRYLFLFTLAFSNLSFYLLVQGEHYYIYANTFD